MEEYTPEKPTDFCAAGFILEEYTQVKTAAVTRGVCAGQMRMDYLTGIDETKNIVKVGNKAAVRSRSSGKGAN